MRGGALLLQPPLGVVLRPPGEHGVGEHVVIELDRAVERSDDSRRRQLCKHAADDVLGHACVLGEIGDAVRDLRSRGRDEVMEHACRGIALARFERAKRALQMRPQDPARASELVQRRAPEEIRTTFPLRLPEPLHHELQVGRLDPLRVARPDRTERDATERDPADDRLIEDGFDETGLDLHGQVRVDLGHALHRAGDRRSCGLAIEAVERQVVAEHIRNQPGEDVELARERPP